MWSLGENYNNLGKLYYYSKRYKEAIAALEKAYQLAQSVGAKGVICDNYEYAAWVYSAIGDYQTAYEKQTSLYALIKRYRVKINCVRWSSALRRKSYWHNNKKKNYASRNIR